MNVRYLGDPPRRTNAEAVRDVAALGWITPGDVTLDATYERGRFWQLWRPDVLFRNDLDPDLPNLDFRHDFRRFPFSDRSFAVVAFDPPYKYAGTSSGRGPGSSDRRYGVREYLSPDARDALICDGARECARVADRVLLVKGMNQVVSGRKRWQVRMICDVVEAEGWRLADRLGVFGYRPQPAGRPQVHSHGDVSDLCVFVRTPSRNPKYLVDKSGGAR